MLRQQRTKVLGIVVLICTIMILIMAIIMAKYSVKAYEYKTYINGVECSFLNIEATENKLEKRMNNTTITLLFADNKKYTCLGTYFDIQIDNRKELENILFKQKEENSANEKIYNIANLYKLNEEKVKKYLTSLAVFKDSNQKPENAYLELDKNNLLIVKPEKYGNELNIEDACNFMISELKKGKATIDFTQITNIEPKIKQTNEKLNSQKDYINSILKTTITYKLHDNSTYKLDANVMKNWIKQGEDGYYEIDLDKNIPIFVEELNDKASYLVTSTKFKATGKGVISVPFGRKTYVTIKEDEEIKRIKTQLEKKESTQFDVLYNSLTDYTKISTYIELDLSRQRVWMYVNGKQILNTPCVTGNVAGGYATPAGIYRLTYKTTDTNLEGYNSDGSKYSSPVKYWMPFNGGIGFHDASWRSNFGGNIYMTNGSHGCVNLPYSAARTLYNNINTSVPIILY